MSADLISAGVQDGCLPLNSAAIPAMCGLAIEVPEYASKLLPALPDGATAATTSTPGGAMSGLRRSPCADRTGPDAEKLAICGARATCRTAAVMDAVAA